MNANELLRLIDSIHRDKNIDKEIVFQAIEAAFASAMKRKHGDEEEEVIVINIDRHDGTITGTRDGVPLPKEETETVGRIGARTPSKSSFKKFAKRNAMPCTTNTKSSAASS